MREYFVYILKCADGSFYTGVCNDLERRLSEHQEGIDPEAYTYKRRPLRLAYNEVFNDIQDAIEREKQIKGWRRAKKKALIDENWDRLVYLALRKADRESCHPSRASG